jgi:hypothetical protein
MPGIVSPFYFLGKLHFTLLEVFTHFYFYLQSSKCDILPLQTFKLWQFNPFNLFISKMSSLHFFFLKKKKNPKEEEEKIQKICWGGSATPAYFFYFYF